MMERKKFNWCYLYGLLLRTLNCYVDLVIGLWHLNWQLLEIFLKY